MRRPAPRPPRSHPLRRHEREVRRLASLDAAAAVDLSRPLDAPEAGGAAGADDGAGEWVGYGLLDATPLSGFRMR
jgi:hypothetical protein